MKVTSTRRKAGRRVVCSQACQEAEDPNCSCGGCGGVYHGVRRKAGPIPAPPPEVVVQPDLDFTSTERSNGSHTEVRREEASVARPAPAPRLRTQRPSDLGDAVCDGCGQRVAIAFLNENGAFGYCCQAKALRWEDGR